jgi:hypothetical protein
MPLLTLKWAKRAREASSISSDLVTTMERLLNRASQCRCRPLFLSITCVLDATSAVHSRAYTANGKLIQTKTSDVCFRGQRIAERPLISALGR